MTIQPAIISGMEERAARFLTTEMPKPGRPAFELEGHIFGILARHGGMRRTNSNGLGIIVAEDDAGRRFKVEISQVAGPA